MAMSVAVALMVMLLSAEVIVLADSVPLAYRASTWTVAPTGTEMAGSSALHVLPLLLYVVVA